MKRKSIVFIVLAAMIAAFVGVAHPATVQACSASFAGSYDAGAPNHFTGGILANAGDTITATASSNLVTSIEITHNATTTPFGGNTITFTAPTSGIYVANFINTVSNGATIQFSFSDGTNCAGSTVGVTHLSFTDGRMNSRDGQETAAVYCNRDGSVNVWTVIDSVGYYAFTATKTDLAKVPAKPLKNTLIKSGLGVSLYRLTSGELQINAPDNYVFTWDGCAAA